MHPTTPCAVVHKFFTVFFLTVFYSFFPVFYSFFLRFFTVFYKAVKWAGDFGAGDLGGLHLGRPGTFPEDPPGHQNTAKGR